MSKNIYVCNNLNKISKFNSCNLLGHLLPDKPGVDCPHEAFSFVVQNFNLVDCLRNDGVTHVRRRYVPANHGEAFHAGESGMNVVVHE